MFPINHPLEKQPGREVESTHLEIHMFSRDWFLFFPVFGRICPIAFHLVCLDAFSCASTRHLACYMAVVSAEDKAA